MVVLLKVDRVLYQEGLQIADLVVRDVLRLVNFIS
jgi:hypothetical protein